MTGSAAPIVAIVHGPGSVGPAGILSAASGGRCRPLFLVDGRESGSSELGHAVAGLADILDVAGLSPADVGASLTDRGVEGITTFSDDKIVATAEFAEHAGLRYASPRTARALTHKHIQRKLLNEAGVGAVRAATVNDASEAKGALERVGVPAVAKPCRGSGSEHVRPVHSIGDLLDQLASDDRRPLCLEEFLVGLPHPDGEWLGDYLSVETITYGPGRHGVLAVADRLRLVPPMREGGLLLPSTLPAERQDLARRTAVAALDAVGMRTGVAHVEIKITVAGPQVVEVNGRIGGYVADLLARVAKVDAVELAMLAALRAAEPVEPCFTDVGLVYLVHPPEWATRVLALADPRAIYQVPGVWRVEQRPDRGAPVNPRAGTKGRLQTVLMAAPTLSGIREAKCAVDEIVKRGNAFA